MSDQKILASSAVMAAGTIVSRLSGYLRTLLIIAALGQTLHADIFTIANTIPNAVYILVAGGVFNAVLVPQLVRAQKFDEDGGDAYASRIITLSAIFLAVVTVVLVVAAPLLLQLYLADRYYEPDRAAHLESAIDFTRYCLPQVFFYGMFVLVGQVLNARRSFGPMMWAPIANNVIAVAVLSGYLLVWGPASEAAQVGPYTSNQELLLGLGSTLGIVAQLLILLPYLRKAGFHYRPRFDFRDTGLGHTLRLGLWTVLFVVVNQIAFLVVTWLASSGTVDGGGTGNTVYASSFLIMMVPHAIVTVSLTTAILPRLSDHAADRRLLDLGRTVSTTLRTALVVVLPFAVLMPVLARDVAGVLFGVGAGDPAAFAPTLALFGPALVFFTVHYLMLRGFYALEQTRRVFWIQCAISATNIALALVLVGRSSADRTAPALVVAWGASYVVGSALSYTALRRTVGGLDTARLLRFVVRMAIVCLLAGAVAWGVERALDGLGEEPGLLLSLLRGGLAGGAGVAVVLLLARALRITEVTSLTDAALSRVRRR
ncbi:murein biosynthesis integral membrane protein MurJ [Nocardioides currus]|uniref:Murein biosynthesis integral membrane protein MurJ n=1 Tax=Nocardioides currus TaxID=2133958 RepID=A0A2R7YXS6_9ACTN|nr:murein biosynthesis integral membrane protein MurJ [Nocardioides currus]PUA81198.1 murein biosynthesis integral membrane protein MurJ [Nocardioides currus]